MNFKATVLLCFFFTGASAQDSLQVNFDSVLAKVSANQVQYKTLSERAVLTWDDGNTAQQFNGNIRVKKDSLIWMSLSMFGFEGARALITQDSFRLLNKLTSEYLVRDPNYIQSWLLLPINFQMLQQIITGERISINERATLAKNEDSSYVLYLESDKLFEKVWVNTQNYTVQKILLKDKLLKQDMLITFDSYNSLNGNPFSYKRNIAINRDGKAMKLDMQITKAGADEELNFPFEVNEKYKRVE